MDQPTRDQLIELAVQQAALAATGSFSERNPNLGKMVRCPFCGRRRRQNAERACCNPTYLQTNKAEIPRSFYAKKRKNPRLTRNRPPLFEMHQILLDKERQTGYKEYEGISGIVEAQIKRRKRAKAVKKTQRRRLSRTLNRKANRRK